MGSGFKANVQVTGALKQHDYVLPFNEQLTLDPTSKCRQIYNMDGRLHILGMNERRRNRLSIYRQNYMEPILEEDQPFGKISFWLKKEESSCAAYTLGPAVKTTSLPIEVGRM